MKVVLTEKPSVARDLAAFLGAKTKREGYFEGQGYQVTWAFGHLVGLKEPDEYDPALKKWSLEPLPFVPERFELKLVGDGGAKKQFAIIKRLFKGASELICATDAGREGELIFRYILAMAGCAKKSFSRLWLSSLTEDAIRKGFQEMRPGKDFDNLYAAARCRSESDWIVGLNGTRNFTVRFGARGILWSLGRVQTPVLSLIASRNDEIQNFRSEPFWELMTNFQKVKFKHTGDRFKDKKKAEALLEKTQGHPFVIEKVQAKKEKSFSPLLYDLTDLQRDMNRRYGMSAAETLKHAQSLYESKALTYPRTDSRYLTSDMKGQIPGILNKLKNIKPQEIAKLKLDALPFSTRIVNDKKVNDHHAIIPTGTLPRTLPTPLQQVYDAVVTRLIAVFYPPCLKEVTTVDGVTNEVPFRAKGVRIIDPGWTALYPKKQDTEAKKNEDEQELPAFTKGMEGPHDPFLKEGKTKPPQQFTENTLLGTMETAGKLIEDETLKEAMKNKGLGTPATRAAMIETLLNRGYIARDKKKLTITDLGRYLMALVQDPNLKSAELTGEWEAKLKEIEYGRLDPNVFMQEIVRFTRNLIQKSDVSIVDESILGHCPRCTKPIIEGRRGFGCSGWKEGCDFVLWKEHKGVMLNSAQARKLLQKKILMQPLQLEGKKDATILCLSEKGGIIEVALPQGRSWKPKKKAGYSKYSRRKKASS